MNRVTSLGRERANRSLNAADWSPRDVLEQVLEEMDNGSIDPEMLVVCWTESPVEGMTNGGSCHSTPSLPAALGVLEFGKLMMFEGGDS